MDTLTKQDNMLRAMFSGRLDVTIDSDGYVLIDRSGKHFEFILNYLRDEDSALGLEAMNEFELYELLKEAKFYCIQTLANLIEQKILANNAANMEPYYGSSIVSMVTSKSELCKILNSTDKPCIRLLINRHNNKYSYTNTSDDNLLKNIELFERMAIKFKNRIMFIKDTTSNEEICCWYFHGNGKKLGEVCCTSIVYTTEKKQTKVEFPDSKILEEIFVNAVLFESKENSSASNENGINSQTSLTPTSTNQLFQTIAEEDSQDDLPRLASVVSTAAASNNCVNTATIVSNSLSSNVSSTSSVVNSLPISTASIAAPSVANLVSSVANISTNGSNISSVSNLIGSSRRTAR
jgi:BTB/POZ domain-containing adapter for CUL3-mediated RhoA degradation protein